MDEERIELYGLDVFDIINLIRRKNGAYIRIVLDELETKIEDPGKFREVRKVVLDGFNNYTRSILRSLLGGNIEGLYFYEDV